MGLKRGNRIAYLVEFFLFLFFCLARFFLASEARFGRHFFALGEFGSCHHSDLSAVRIDIYEHELVATSKCAIGVFRHLDLTAESAIVADERAQVQDRPRK